MSPPPHPIHDEERIRAEMAARLAELQRLNEANVKMRQAALNIMEDALAARTAAEREAGERRRAEGELLAIQEQLEKRVSERTAALNKTNDALRSEIAERKKIETQRRKLLRRLANAEESERRRISRELHDEIGQHLAALTMSLKTIETGKGQIKMVLREARQIAEKVGREIHDLALELRPTALDDLGLRQALSNYADEWARKTKIAVDFHTAGLGRRRLPTTVESAIYRIGQEALTNILKHARARRVSLILERHERLVSLIVEDDGHGFDTNKKMANSKLGLLGMQERAAQLDGEVTVESKQRKGTTIFVRIPLSPTKKKKP